MHLDANSNGDGSRFYTVRDLVAEFGLSDRSIRRHLARHGVRHQSVVTETGRQVIIPGEEVARLRGILETAPPGVAAGVRQVSAPLAFPLAPEAREALRDTLAEAFAQAWRTCPPPLPAPPQAAPVVVQAVRGVLYGAGAVGLAVLAGVAAAVAGGIASGAVVLRLPW